MSQDVQTAENEKTQTPLFYCSIHRPTCLRQKNLTTLPNSATLKSEEVNALGWVKA
jgi:hypothetical protein